MELSGNSGLEPLSSGQPLSVLSYLVLGLVGQGGAGAHDLVRLMRQGQIYCAVSPSKLYSEPKRLARLGYLEAQKEPGRTRPRTVYRLTERGRDAVCDWMDEPASFPRLQHEATVRVLCADLAGPQRVLRSLRGMRVEIERALDDVALMERQAESHPHRRSNLLLNHWLGRRWCELQLAWLDEAERVLGDEGELGGAA